MQLKNDWVTLSILLVSIAVTAYIANQWPYAIVIGLLMNSLLAAYIHRLRLRNSTVQQLVTEKTRALDTVNDKLEKLSRTDDLTQLANHRYFDEYLEIEWFRARREKTSLSLVLIDVDYFKNYNDYYGHSEGDRCLQRMALSLRSCFVRSGDLVARYEGEEFAAILPATELGCNALIEKCREVIMALAIDHATSPISDVVTISLGACTIVPSESLDVADIIRTAENALSRAKREGRNRGVVFDFRRGNDNQGVISSTEK